MDGQKKVMQELDADDTDIGREDTMESDGTASEGDSSSVEDEDDMTHAFSPPRSLFAPFLLPMSAHLVPTISTPSIPPFG